VQKSDSILTQLRELCVCQHLDVLATDDLRRFFFATNSATLVRFL